MSTQKNITSIKTVNKVKKALEGMAEILHLNLNKDDYLYLAAMDNLEALSQNIPKLFEHSKASSKNIIDKLEQLTFKKVEGSKETEITK